MINWFPGHMRSSLKIVQKLLKRVDVVVEVGLVCFVCFVFWFLISLVGA
jgi:ribosome biogenesis GTPase A